MIWPAVILLALLGAGQTWTLATKEQSASGRVADMVLIVWTAAAITLLFLKEAR